MDSLTESLLLDRRRAGRPDSTSRRTRVRLRDLCDEVLASFRMARQQDQFTERDRAEGRRLVEQIAGRTR